MTTKPTRRPGRPSSNREPGRASNVYLPADVRAELDDRSARTGESLSATIARDLRAYYAGLGRGEGLVDSIARLDCCDILNIDDHTCVMWYAPGTYRHEHSKRRHPLYAKRRGLDEIAEMMWTTVLTPFPADAFRLFSRNQRIPAEITREGKTMRGQALIRETLLRRIDGLLVLTARGYLYANLGRGE